MAVESVIVLNDFCHAQGGASRVAIDEAIALRAAGLRGPVPRRDRTGLSGVVRRRCFGGLPGSTGTGRSRHRTRAAFSAIWNQAAYRTMRAMLRSLDRQRTVVHLHGYTKSLSTAPAVAARRRRFRHGVHAARLLRGLSEWRVLQLPAQDTLHFAGICPRLVWSPHATSGTPFTKRIGPLAARCSGILAGFPAGVEPLHRSVRPLRRCVAALSAALTHGFIRWPTSSMCSAQRPADPGANRNLMVVGRLDEEKGVLLAALAAACAGLPIVFVGDGPHRAAIEAAGARVTGWLTAAEVYRELDTAQLSGVSQPLV